MSSQQLALDEGEVLAYIGAVVKAVPKGKQPFVVAYPLPESVTEEMTKDTSITFPLCGWSGQNGQPRLQQTVVLEGVGRYPKGWRAASARPATISSKQQAGDNNETCSR